MCVCREKTGLKGLVVGGGLLDEDCGMGRGELILHPGEGGGRLIWRPCVLSSGLKYVLQQQQGVFLTM